MPLVYESEVYYFVPHRNKSYKSKWKRNEEETERNKLENDIKE